LPAGEEWLKLAGTRYFYLNSSSTLLKCIAIYESIRGEAVSQAKVRPMMEAKNILITQIAVNVNKRFSICKFRKN
jgi:hypothetical protein